MQRPEFDSIKDHAGGISECEGVFCSKPMEYEEVVFVLC